MALKLWGFTLPKNPNSAPVKTGVSYGEHLGTSNYKPVVGTVLTEKKHASKEPSGQTGESKTLHPGVITNGTSITVEGRRTLNLGNYESAHIGVSLTVPCFPDDLESAYEYATNWVSGKIDEAVKAAKGE